MSDLTHILQSVKDSNPQAADTLRSARPSSAVFLIFILLFGSWIIFGSARWFSFEGWILATGAGLVLLKVAKRPRQADSHAAEGLESGVASRPARVPGQALRQGAFELLKFAAAWACLAVFFALMVPEFPANYQPRHWFSLLVGIASLFATAWCLSHQSSRSSTSSVLVVILLFGFWIISVSPYRLLISSNL